MIVIAFDPGPKLTALVVWDGEAVLESQYLPNVDVLRWMADTNHDGVLAIEMIAHMGMAVGQEVFDTCRWVGRFEQGWAGIDEPEAVALVYRKAVKLHLCGSNRAKDPNVRRALIDRFGGKGKKCRECGGKGWRGRGRLTCPACDGACWEERPGATAGITDHKWAALAVGVTWFDQHQQAEAAA